MNSYGVGHYEAKFRMNGHVSRRYSYGSLDGPGNDYTTTLPLEVFTQGNSVVDFIRLKLNFIKKTKNRFFSHHMRHLGVMYALHL